MDAGLILLIAGGLVFVALVGAAVRKMARGEMHEGTRPAALEPGEEPPEVDEAALAEEALALPRPSQGPPPPERPSSLPPPPAVTPLAQGLAKTKTSLMGRIQGLLFGGRALAPELLDEMEEILVTSDIGVKASTRILEDLKGRVTRRELDNAEAVYARLKSLVLETVEIACPPLPFERRPMVLMVIGVNGVGKTTTIGKIAAQLAKDGKKVVLAAGDTFRAAATEQLEIWAQRSGAIAVKGASGGDPAAVIFEAIQRAQKEGADVCIADTAGRLHTKVNLMEELKKLRRVMDKAEAGAPHEVMLVLDATMGQNAIAQAREFTSAVQVGSIALTKLDGTAKGGVVVAIADELKIPVRYIGVGEGIDDLRPFSPRDFVEALFERDGRS